MLLFMWSQMFCAYVSDRKHTRPLSLSSFSLSLSVGHDCQQLSPVQHPVFPGPTLLTSNPEMMILDDYSNYKETLLRHKIGRPNSMPSISILFSSVCVAAHVMQATTQGAMQLGDGHLGFRSLQEWLLQVHLLEGWYNSPLHEICASHTHTPTWILQVIPRAKKQLSSASSASARNSKELLRLRFVVRFARTLQQKQIWTLRFSPPVTIETKGAQWDGAQGDLHQLMVPGDSQGA